MKKISNLSREQLFEIMQDVADHLLNIHKDDLERDKDILTLKEYTVCGLEKETRIWCVEPTMTRLIDLDYYRTEIDKVKAAILLSKFSAIIEKKNINSFSIEQINYETFDEERAIKLIEEAKERERSTISA